MSKMAQEQRYSYQRITTVVALRVDDPAVTFATDDCAYTLHLSYNIYFSYCTCTICTAMRFGNVAQGTGT
jgi:hypothetical protein